MNLVDSCGWLEYFSDGDRAEFFSGAIEDTENLIVPTICILEVFKRILQQREEGVAFQAIAAMYQGHIIDLNLDIALSAAKMGSELKLPLADSVSLATAKSYGAVIWTQDAHFKDIEGVKYIPAKPHK